ncbi:hypothetical protein WME89_19760 [Sorangium sp. So ce321]|uniref:hypothetical protein n=1 Tax=Sorangium sp. So ce321 TaxID=3133300 RepID=UPI003F5F050A
MKPLSRDARRIMDAARSAEEPSSADRARIREKLLRRAGALAAAQATASATTSTASATLPAAPSAVAGGAGAGGAAATGAGGMAATGAGAAVPFAAGGLGGLLAKIGAAAALLGALGGGAAVALREPPAAPAARHAAVHVTRITEAGINAPPPALATAAAPSNTAAAAPPVPPRLPAAPPAAEASGPGEPSPVTPTPARRVPPAFPVGSDARAPSAASASASPAGSTLPGELALLRGAQGALRAGDAGRALALLEDHAAEFRDGALREERRAARVFALCALGRIDESRAEAARFLRDAPRSPLAERVRAACTRAAAP